MADNTQRITKMTELLQAALSPEYLHIVDDSHLHVGHPGAKSGGGHFTVFITAKAFNDKTAILRHKLVYTALASMMQHDIHALSIHAKPTNTA